MAPVGLRNRIGTDAPRGVHPSAALFIERRALAGPPAGSAFEKGVPVKKLCLAWAVMMPLIGCTGAVDEDLGTPGGAVDPNGSGGSSGSLPGMSGGSSSVAGSGVVSGVAGESVNGSGSAANGGAANGGAANGGAASGGMGSGGSSSGGNCTTPAPMLPATVQNMLNTRCVTCHGATPLLPTLPSLTDYASLTAPSKSDPTKTNAVVSLARIQDTNMPMPPKPGSPATAAEIAALQDFIMQGYPKPAPICTGGSGGSGSGGAGGASGGAGGSAGAGGMSMDPLNAAPTCTSMSKWTGGNRESASMNPGMACISCHSRGEGPSFSIAGTVYPTGHEPDLCNSTVGNAGARVVIIGADGQQVTLTPNAAGNFSSRNAIKLPYQAKITYQGRERLMLTAQTSGDCNSCHTQNGDKMAPGRITVP